MKKTLSLIIAILVFSSIATAQRYTIKGKILDAISKEKLPYSSISLHYKTDTLGIYKGIIADTNGDFEIKNVRKRDMILKVSFVGYKPFRKEIGLGEFDKEKILDLGNLFMELSGELAAVEITAKIERIIVDDDKLTMNVDEQLAATVTSAFDLLKRVPGVFIDKDDNLTLNGKSGVLFQYNGRDLRMQYKSVVDLLKSMTPDQVESFEVLTNPGVRYDAEGTAGIINIKIKKNQNYGINGSVWGRASYQTMLNYYGSMSLSYVDDKWTTSLGFSPMKWGSKGTSKSERYTAKGVGDTVLFKTESEDEWQWLNNNIYLNASYLIDTTRTIGFNLYGSFGGNPEIYNEDPYLISSYPNYNIVDSSYLSGRSSITKRRSLGFGIDYVKKLDTLDSKFMLDLSYSHNSDISNSESWNKYFIGDLNTILDREEGFRRQDLSPDNDLSFRADYYKPFTKTMKLETGLKTYISFSDNDYRSEQLDPLTGNYVNVPMETNRFKYFENINSLYASFSNTFKKKLNVRLGIRLEQTNTKGHQYVLDSIDKRSYFDIFPNLRLNYKFKDDNQLTLSYSYRISRPWSGSLNPFMQKSSEYSYSTGNPYLNPQYSNSISLSHSWKYMLFTNVSYSHTKDDINWIRTPLDTNLGYNPLALMSSSVNFGSSHNLNFNISFNKEFFKWWSFRASTGANYSQILSSPNELDINRESWSYNASLSSDFTLPKKWRLGFYYYFRSSSMYGLSTSSSYQDLSINISKSFFEEKLGLTLSIDDFVNINKMYRETVYRNTITKNWSSYQGPQVALSLRYRFGKYYKNKQVSKPSVESFDDRVGGGSPGGGR